MKTVLLLAFYPLLAAGPAFAAPLCVEVTGMTPQCFYVDPASCQREATRQGGRCAANPTELLTPAGGAPFCVVQSGNAVSCVYADRASCDAASKRVKGACIAAVPAPPPKPVIDPYILKRPY
jgi:hypothetical protein